MQQAVIYLSHASLLGEVTLISNEVFFVGVKLH
jgi:hypothetical protein